MSRPGFPSASPSGPGPATGSSSNFFQAPGSAAPSSGGLFQAPASQPQSNPFANRDVYCIPIVISSFN